MILKMAHLVCVLQWNDMSDVPQPFLCEAWADVQPTPFQQCCTTQPCQCESVPDTCTVITDYHFAWVDIITNAEADTTVTRINNGDWTQNDDDGWYTIPDIGFDFHWFGHVERAITIGTNGVLTFGAGQLPYGSSEPVPCSYGDSGCAGANHDASGVPIEGVIAPLWCDLNPSTANGGLGEGVYFQIVTVTDPRLVAWNKLTVEYQTVAFGTENMLHFEVILFGDGSVVFQYQDMPADSGSWSEESIGFEDQSGAIGVQIMFDTMPDSQSAYRIPPSCHVTSGSSEVPTCCSSSVCQCEGVQASCEVDTSFPFAWVDIITSPTSTRIEDSDWEQNADDGWLHIDLPFDFHWFGQTERRITIGTNGVLTFGDGQLPFGTSEPVPCAYGGTGCTNAVVVDGVIAPLWCDLNPATATAGAGEGVYYQIINDGGGRDGSNGLGVAMESFNKLIVEYQVETFTSAGSEQHQDHVGSQGVHFEVILFGDGSVLFQYKEMPSATGSWSLESVGFEDHSGAMGVQILFGTVPDSNTAYMIPATCHQSETSSSSSQPAGLEFYFGSAMPTTAGPTQPSLEFTPVIHRRLTVNDLFLSAGPNAVLDTGVGFAHHYDGSGAGLDYGWDCDGNTNVDYSAGRRGLNRDHGLGINHFDRDSTCSGNVNWQIALPNGLYTVEVSSPAVTLLGDCQDLHFTSDHDDVTCAVAGRLWRGPGDSIRRRARDPWLRGANQRPANDAVVFVDVSDIVCDGRAKMHVGSLIRWRVRSSAQIPASASTPTPCA